MTTICSQFFRAATVVLAVGALSSGCLEPQKGTVAGQVEPPTAEPPATEPPTTEPPSTEPPAACEVTGYDVEVRLFEAADQSTGMIESMLPPVVAQGGIYGHQRGTTGSNAANDSELFFLDASSHEVTQLTANDGDDVLVDARAGAMLFERVDPATGTRALMYADADGEAVLDADIGFNGGYGPWEDDFSGSVRRRVEPGLATWRHKGNAQLLVWDGQQTHIASAGLATGTPDAAGGAVVWAEEVPYQVPREIFVWRDGVTQQLTEDERSDVQPVLGATRLFWNSDNAVVTAGLDGSGRRVLDEGPCGAVNALGDKAVFACADDPEVGFGGSLLFWDNARRLVVFDGEETREVGLTGEGSLFAPRLTETRIAWIQYPSAAISGVYPPVLGNVWVAPLDGSCPASPTPIAEIGAGCYTCQVPWPPPALAASGDVVAWNYAVLHVGSEAPAVGGLGYAVIDELTD